jgi:hypothetical protein
MTVKEIPTKTKCKCNHMFIEHYYDVEEVIHFGPCKHGNCNCNKFSPIPDTEDEASNLSFINQKWSNS